MKKTIIILSGIALAVGLSALLMGHGTRGLYFMAGGFVGCLAIAIHDTQELRKDLKELDKFK